MDIREADKGPNLAIHQTDTIGAFRRVYSAIIITDFQHPTRFKALMSKYTR